MPPAKHSTALVVGPQGARGIMRRLSSQVVKAKEVSSIFTKFTHLLLLQRWSGMADSKDGIATRSLLKPWAACDGGLHFDLRLELVAFW